MDTAFDPHLGGLESTKHLTKANDFSRGPEGNGQAAPARCGGSPLLTGAGRYFTAKDWNLKVSRDNGSVGGIASSCSSNDNSAPNAQSAMTMAPRPKDHSPIHRLHGEIPEGLDYAK
jgi:hypothetical protein